MLKLLVDPAIEGEDIAVVLREGKLLLGLHSFEDESSGGAEGRAHGEVFPLVLASSVGVAVVVERLPGSRVGIEVQSSSIHVNIKVLGSQKNRTSAISWTIR